MMGVEEVVERELMVDPFYFFEDGDILESTKIGVQAVCQASDQP